MTDTGFMASLTGSQDDEKSLARQQRLAMLAKGGSAMHAALGNMGGGGIKALAGGVSSFFGENKHKTFMQGLKDGIAGAQDQQDAAILGIAPREIAANRAVRTGMNDIEDDGSYGARIKMAARAAKIYSAMGDSNGLGRALQQLDQLREEEREFQKLGIAKDKAEVDLKEAGLVDAYRPDGAMLTGELTEDENGKPSLEYFDHKLGRTVTEPFGTALLREDPIRAMSRGGAGTESLDQAIRKYVPSDGRKTISNLITSTLSGMRRTRQVMSTMMDLWEEGGTEQVLGAAGGVSSWLVRTTRSLQGFADSAFGLLNSRDKLSDTNLRNKWAEKAKDATDPIWQWLELPPELLRAGDAAERYRAQIMELAYMAARLAEPSNRGLSDNDIENALTRIVGNTGNPQTLMARLSEMIMNGAYDVENTIDSWTGALLMATDAQGNRRWSEDQVEFGLGGKALESLRTERQKLMDDFNFTEDENMRVSFHDPIDEIVNPGEGIPVPINTVGGKEIDFATASAEELEAWMAEQERQNSQ